LPRRCAPRNDKQEQGLYLPNPSPFDCAQGRLTKEGEKAKKMKKTFIIVVLLMFVAACATKVKVHRMVPAKFDVAGVMTIAVGEFESGCCASSRWASELTHMLERRLDANIFYTVVPGAPGVGADDAGGKNAAWRAWVKKEGVDGILGGTVREADVDTDWDYERKKKKVERDGKTYTKVKRIPIVHRTARLRVAATLFDAKTGERLSHEEYAEDSDSRARGRDQVRRMPDENDMIERLVDRVADRVMRGLVPHLMGEKLRLAEDKDCAEGNKLARNGDWGAAQDLWKSVVAANPRNHVAYYNLGIAAEVAKRYNEAADYYRKAVKIDGRKRYRKALARAERRERDEKKLEKQMEGR